MREIPNSPLHHIIAPKVYRIMGYSDLHQLPTLLKNLTLASFDECKHHQIDVGVNAWLLKLATKQSSNLDDLSTALRTCNILLDEL